ncbi:MAG TPA: gephyrin-like molybdotransferase Glp [Candidatus Binatia bacterium]|nr:gephyrin-like molybdotransferase Glp [Candidatus Binatia bacterium]
MSTQTAPALVLTFEEARRAVLDHCQAISPAGRETVFLIDSARRVLGEEITADRHIPPFPRATRDGYAVRAADLAAVPARLKIVGEIRAGAPIKAMPPVKVGEAVAIMTGAPVPAGADAVVMVEFTSQNRDFVEIARAAAAGENIVPRGAEAKRGSALLSRGSRMNETAVALAASVGKSKLEVFTRPRVAVLTTGDEIVPVEISPGVSQIRNSNSYSLAVQIQEAGGEPHILPIAPDQPGRLRELIEEGLRADLLIMTGGVSMGRYDLVEQTLQELRAEFFFTGAKIQPGRPVVFGRCPAGRGEGSKYFFGLPGNPVSTMVTFELFARPLLEALSGMEPRSLMFYYVRAKPEIRSKTGLTRFLPAILSGECANVQAELVPWQGSGDIAAQARANCWIVIPPDSEKISAGDWVAIIPR